MGLRRGWHCPCRQHWDDNPGRAGPSCPVGAPLTAMLHYHHEMTYVAESTLALAFMCEKSVPDGRAATYFSEAQKHTDFILGTELGQKLKEKGVCFHRNLTD